MCGRFAQQDTTAAYLQLLGVVDPVVSGDAGAREVRPTQNAWVCALGRDGLRHLRQLRWGLVPAWSRGPDSRFSMFNARAETVHQKPAFREAFRLRRCLVPAEGFFEWAQVGGRKRPHAIRRIDGAPLVFAGLWEHWKGRSGEAINSFTIIVTDANPLIAPIHDRMPVILDPAAFDLWLTPDADPAELRALLRPCPPEGLEARAVELNAVSGPGATDR